MTNDNTSFNITHTLNLLCHGRIRVLSFFKFFTSQWNTIITKDYWRWFFMKSFTIFGQIANFSSNLTSKTCAIWSLFMNARLDTTIKIGVLSIWTCISFFERACYVQFVNCRCCFWSEIYIGMNLRFWVLGFIYFLHASYVIHITCLNTSHWR